jgi:hypothetical protein
MADLPWSQPRASQYLDLMFRDVVVEQDHAAVFAFGDTSRTIPLLLRATASQTA